jgi:hypothetical protein
MMTGEVSLDQGGVLTSAMATTEYDVSVLALTHDEDAEVAEKLEEALVPVKEE